MEPRLEDWIGRSETRHDIVTAAPLQALRATLDYPAVEVGPGSPLPPFWHWLYFLPMARASELGEDGHARRGGFLPPVTLPRRMWAGGQLELNEPLRVGDRVARTSTIDDVRRKDGRSGSLVFVKVRHELRCNGAQAPAVVELQDIVYREAQRAGDLPPEPRPAPAAEPGVVLWRREIVPDPVLLFRYSALTFNGHRIHYDRSYATGVEGYPGLVVHGPLIATLLLDLVQRERPDAAVASFSFRAVRPVFDLNPFSVNGAPQPGGRESEGGSVRLWAADHEGWLAMEASARFR
ncbi:MAG: acyl-CoA dehydrogenase [Burkholderiaceae bacterium]|nr:acyl-CoA dehydrogenase [Burkholderiaceae bacterium]